MKNKNRYALEYLHELFSAYYSEKPPLEEIPLEDPDHKDIKRNVKSHSRKKGIIADLYILAEISPKDPEYQNVKKQVKSHIVKLRHSVSMTQEFLKNCGYVPGFGVDNSAQNEAKRFERFLEEFLIIMEHEATTWGDEENWLDISSVRTFEINWEKFLAAAGATYFFKNARKVARASKPNTINAKKTRSIIRPIIDEVVRRNPEGKAKELWPDFIGDLEATEFSLIDGKEMKLNNEQPNTWATRHDGVKGGIYKFTSFEVEVSKIKAKIKAKDKQNKKSS